MYRVLALVARARGRPAAPAPARVSRAIFHAAGSFQKQYAAVMVLTPYEILRLLIDFAEVVIFGLTALFVKDWIERTARLVKAQQDALTTLLSRLLDAPKTPNAAANMLTNDAILHQNRVSLRTNTT